MSGFWQGVEIALAVLFVIGGIRAVMRPVVLADMREGDRALLAIFEASRAGVWFSLAGLFLGFALIQDAESWRWFALVPILMAGLRMLSSALLSRRP